MNRAPLHCSPARWLATLLIILLATPTAPAQHLWPVNLRPATEPTIADALAWLPSDSEVIAVDDSKVVDQLARGLVGDADVGLKAELPFRLFLDDRLREFLSTLLSDVRLKWSVMGIGDYEAPVGVCGRFSPLGCCIARYEGDLSRACAAFDQATCSTATREYHVGSRTIIELGAPARRRKAGTFIVRPHDGIVIIGSDRAYLERVLRIKESQEARTDWACLVPGWKHIEPTWPSWVLTRERTNGPVVIPRNLEIADRADLVAVCVAVEAIVTSSRLVLQYHAVSEAIVDQRLAELSKDFSDGHHDLDKYLGITMTPGAGVRRRPVNPQRFTEFKGAGDFDEGAAMLWLFLVQLLGERWWM